MIRAILFLAVLLGLMGCKEQPAEIKSTVLKGPSLTIDERGFDSCMHILESNYSFKHHLLPDKNENYLNIYSLEKRIYMPKLRNLTFDLYQFRRFSDVMFPVVYLHNDSFQFVLPFIDFDFYRVIEEGKDTFDYNKSLSLSKEYGRLFQLFQPTQFYEKIQVMDVIMSFLSAERVYGKAGAEIFEAKTKEFMISPGLYQKCPDEIMANMAVIKKRIIKGSITYINGVMAFVFERTADGRDSLAVYNRCCALSTEEIYR